MLFKYNLLRAVRPVNVPLLMTVILLPNKNKEVIAARPVNAPL